MIKYIKGDIFTSDAEVLVNPVNTVGIMGAGLASAFRVRFPENYELYREACKRGEVVIGKMFMTKVNSPIINFPTKEHWKNSSKLEYIYSGLTDLRRVIVEERFFSIAIPALGCGLGGLDWLDVKNAIQDELKDMENVAISVYRPGGK